MLAGFCIRRAFVVLLKKMEHVFGYMKRCTKELMDREDWQESWISDLELSKVEGKRLYIQNLTQALNVFKEKVIKR